MCFSSHRCSDQRVDIRPDLMLTDSDNLQDNSLALAQATQHIRIYIPINADFQERSTVA